MKSQGIIELKQRPDHLYDLVVDGKRVDICDQLAAEEFAHTCKEFSLSITWTYLQDISKVSPDGVV